MPKGHEQLKAVKTRDCSGCLYASTKKEGKTTDQEKVDRLTRCKTNTTALLKQKQQYIKRYIISYEKL